MHYLSPTRIISNELKLMSWKSFRTFHGFSSNAKFLPRAQLIRACFLAQQGWLCTCTLRASQTLSPRSPEELCLCEQTKALAFHDFQSTGSSFWSQLLRPLQIGCSLCPSPSNPIYILFTSGYVGSAEVPELAIELPSSGAAVDVVVWSSVQTNLPTVSLNHLKLL